MIWILFFNRKNVKKKPILNTNWKTARRLRHELTSEMCPDVQDFEDCDDSFSVWRLHWSTQMKNSSVCVCVCVCVCVSLSVTEFNRAQNNYSSSERDEQKRNCIHTHTLITSLFLSHSPTPRLPTPSSLARTHTHTLRVHLLCSFWSKHLKFPSELYIVKPTTTTTTTVIIMSLFSLLLLFLSLLSFICRTHTILLLPGNVCA